ncbi:hypothetical protein HGRIS_012915 [Hohenbuehelia grisea]|uniref:gamma-glutamylcyclotransferase n=1 Tax=Hohenbuehelia grisea TaxID=104357 RepID=A0ABR3IU31_9AGAR
MTVYFAYGSNLWLDQMKRRCPESQLIGVAVLHDWLWIINQRGYANVIPSAGDIVYGLVFKLNERDEETLDGYEGVPSSYEKRTLSVVSLPIRGQTNAKDSQGREEERSIEALVYVDTRRKNAGPPQEEYIYRINMGVKDALEQGIPLGYVEKYIRPLIPEIPADIDASQI